MAPQEAAAKLAQEEGTGVTTASGGTAEVFSGLPKLRILCLHGFRTSGEILAQQVTMAKWGAVIDDIAELVFIDAPWPARGKSDVEKKFAGPYYEWYQSNEDFSEGYGIDEATTHISDYISLHGPFDGVLGFSQGAVLAAALMGLSQKGLAPGIQTINFLILVGGGRSRARHFKSSFVDTLLCPSLHFIGDKDFMNEMGETLLLAFKDPTVIRHPFGHVVPKLGANEGMICREFLLKQLQSKSIPAVNT